MGLVNDCAWPASRDKLKSSNARDLFIIVSGLMLVSDVRVDGLNMPVCIVDQFCYFNASQMRDAFGQTGIMVKQIPLAVELTDRMMRGPSHNGIEDSSRVFKWPIRIVANSITKKMRITGGIREIIFPVVLMDPAGFKKSPVFVAREQRLTVLTGDHHVFWRFCKLQQVIAQPRTFAHKVGSLSSGRWTSGPSPSDWNVPVLHR